MVVRRTGLPDVSLDEKTVFGDVVLAGLEALEHFDVTAAAATQLFLDSAPPV